jgi:hypothetical protein
MPKAPWGSVVIGYELTNPPKSSLSPLFIDQPKTLFFDPTCARRGYS